MRNSTWQTANEMEIFKHRLGEAEKEYSNREDKSLEISQADLKQTTTTTKKNKNKNKKD